MGMKVVINACFGGFNLSDKAILRCVELGMTLTEWNDKGNFKDDSADFCKPASPGSRGYHGYSIVSDRSDQKFRSNPIVVGVVKELGEDADGECASLKVIEIPFDGPEGWEIDEYDGKESIVRSGNPRWN